MSFLEGFQSLWRILNASKQKLSKIPALLESHQFFASFMLLKKQRPTKEEAQKIKIVVANQIRVVRERGGVEIQESG